MTPDLIRGSLEGPSELITHFSVILTKDNTKAGSRTLHSASRVISGFQIKFGKEVWGLIIGLNTVIPRFIRGTHSVTLPNAPAFQHG